MKPCVTLLLFAGLAYGAPVVEQSEQFVNDELPEIKAQLVKRAQETIMFGNQQNRSKMKRSDPNVPTLPDDNIPTLPDNKGTVRALPPQEVSEEETEVDDKESEQALVDTLNSNGQEVDEEVSENVNDDVTKGEEEATVNEGGENTDEQDEEGEKVENAEINDEIVTPADEIPETESEEETSSEEGVTEEGDSETKEEPEVETEPEEDYDAYLWDWLSVLPENNRGQDYPEGYYNDYYPRYQPYHQRLLNIQTTKPSAASDREVKRSHRTKRDLLFPEDDTDPYYLTPADVSEALYGEEQEPLSEYDDPYYDLLEEEDAPTFADELEEEEIANDIRPIVYQGQPGYFVPAKRSDFLSFVPGNKRDQYFYPFSSEPDTHWGAFIPSKRDYTDSYANLVRLARQLADRERPREFEGYRGYVWQ